MPSPSGQAVLDAPVASPVAAPPLRLLAYVHLRNIHGSTGAGRVARQLVEHLALRPDVQLEVLADARDREHILPLVGEPWTTFRYRTFARETSRQQAQWYLLNRPRAERFAPDAQVVFCTAESYVPVRRARLAVTVHDAAYFEAGAHRIDGAFTRQRLKWRLLFARLARTVDMIHTVSAFSAERIAHFFPALSARIRIVPNAVTPHFFLPVPSSGRAALAATGIPAADRPFVLIPGGLHFRKNADLILAALPRLLALEPDLTVVLVNHSDPAYRAQAEALGSRVQLLGFVSDELLHALYAASAVVWFPSRYEGFGLPVIEAMASSAPVVASNASSLPEIAGGAALLADPASPGDHVDAIRHLLADASAADHLRRLGRARAQTFSWTASAARLKRCFDDLL